MKKILVMCHGNINRSPLCAQILKQKTNWDIKSAGFVNPNRRAAKKMRDVAIELGYNLEEHRSQLISKELHDWADMIIIMDGGNQKRLRDFQDSPEISHIHPNTHRLGHFIEPRIDRIPDPAFIKRGTKEFHDVVLLIKSCTLNLIEHLRNKDLP